MTEVHPLIAATRTFREETKGFVYNEACLTEGLFTALFSAVRNDAIRSELGKEVMRLQFSEVSDENLLQMWRLTLATERRQDPAAVISTMGSFLRRQEEEKRRTTEEAERKSKAEAEEIHKRTTLKKSFDLRLESLNLSPKLVAKLSEHGICYVGDLVQYDREEIEALLGRKVWVCKLIDILNVCESHYMLYFGQKEISGWWSPPAE